MKYGPLWFALLRHAEKIYGAKAVQEYGSYALRNVCHELHWKIHFEVAAAYSRERNLPESRNAIASAAMSCPEHLRWKVWLLAARSELWDGSPEASRQLLAQAKADAPPRVQVSVCVEQARAEEFLNNLQQARDSLEEARACEGHDWKVFLERIFMEARHGLLDAARAAALNALEQHPATGRLWSALIALEHSGDRGPNAAVLAFQKAANEVPKSGEVWCEGARVYMNPLGPHFNLARARRCLEVAVHLTPQYGDSFLEMLRLRFLLELRLRMRADPLAIGLLGAPGTASSAPSQAAEGHRFAAAAMVTQRACSRAVAELRAGRFAFTAGDPVLDGADADSTGLPDGISLGDAEGSHRSPLAMWRLEVLCAYADPHYGFLWFWCRDSALSTPREVLQRMHAEVVTDLVAGGTLWAYAWAVACGIFGLPADDRVARGGGEGGCGDSAGIVADGEAVGPNGSAGFAARDFSIGSLRLARCFTSAGGVAVEQVERRRLIFGSDILCV